jgi:hypothetical protein
MAEKYYGLCETCEHNATCTLRRSTQLKIIQCEEFSIRPLEAAKKTSIDQSIQEAANVAELGICINCQNVRTCSFPNARCGVLQCEEYMLGEAGEIPSPNYSRSAA